MKFQISYHILFGKKYFIRKKVRDKTCRNNQGRGVQNYINLHKKFKFP